MDVFSISDGAVDAFLSRWLGGEGGQERANYALFLTELCDLLGIDHPNPAGASHESNDYVFERVVKRARDDGETLGRIDLYRRGAFVLEAKQSRQKGGAKAIPGQSDLFKTGAPEESRGRRGADRAWDVLMLNAKRQAEDYARALPVGDGWPPFILVCDVGHCIEVYADFSGQGKNYTQFPDRQSFRIYMEDLRKAEVRDRLRAIWLDPHALDPAKKSAKVTRDIARRLAAVSQVLEKQKYPPQDVAMFLMRCLFTMFAEDVGLLPDKLFSKYLHEYWLPNPASFAGGVGALWRDMNEGRETVAGKLLRFNGGLFADQQALALSAKQLELLAEAAKSNWAEVDPSIFGTLLERALSPEERQDRKSVV